MKTTIANKIFIEDASKELYYWCQDNLVVTNPEYATLMRIGKTEQIRRYHIKPKMSLYSECGLDLTLPFGCLRAIWKFIKDGQVEAKFNHDFPIACPNDLPADKPFDYQEEAVRKMTQAKSGILIGGCGSGKTNCGIEIIRRIGLNALWLCHTKDLLNQTVQRIKRLYPNMPVGTITDGKVDMVQNGITVSTVQTLANIEPEEYVSRFNTVVCDEAHHVSGSPTLMKYFSKVITRIPARYKFGLTASDSRNDTLTLSMYANIGYSLDGNPEPVWRIARENARTMTATHEKVELDTPFSYDMLNEDGTFNYAGLVDYISTYQPRNEFIADKVSGIAREGGHKQLVLCSRIEQCETLNQMLLDRQVKSVLLVGKVTDKKRKAILNQETDWDVIVATVSLAKEGLDVVNLDTLHLASCLGNKSDTVQSVGRIERVCEGKCQPIAYDYVDTNIPYLASRYKKRAGWLRNRR